MAAIYVMDEYEKDRLLRHLREAETLSDVKAIIIELLDILPVEYDR